MIKQSLVTKKLSKRILINYEDAASIIGGVWGLWIGLSATVLISMGAVIIPKLKIDFATESEPSRSTTLANVIHLGGALIITSVFFWQMYLFIHDYYQYKVIQVKSIEDQDATSFPSIYICSNNRIFSNQEILKENVKLVEKLNNLKLWLSSHDHYFRKYTSEFSQEEKMLLSPNIQDFIHGCQILTSTGEALPCKANEIKFRVKYTPTVCATIDPMESINQSTVIIKEILLELKVPRSEWFVSSHRFLTVSLNPMSVINVFKGNKFDQFKVSPGDLLNIKYSLTEMRKLPEPYESKCIDESTKYTIWPKSIEEIGKSFNYSYNFQDCMDLCLEKMQHNTLDQDDYNRQRGGRRELNFVLSLDVLSICQCKQPCRSKIYDIKTDEAYNTYKDRKGLDNVTDYENLIDILWAGRTVVRVQRESSQMTVYSDHPKTNPSSLVGAIGGISGIWVGQSLLNIYVELQLLCAVAFKAIKRKLSTDENFVKKSKMVYIASSFLSALVNIRGSQSKGRKTIWLILFSLATSLAIYHTAHVFSSYFGSNITKDATTKEMNREEFAVTFCVNGLENHQNFDKKAAAIFEKNVISDCDFTNPSLSCLSHLSEKDRFRSGNSFWDYINYVPMGCQLSHVFNNVNFGKCGTYKITPNSERGRMFDFQLKNKESLFMLVHERDSSPVFTSQNIISLKEEKTFIKFISKIVDYRNSWWSFGSPCVSTPRTIPTWTEIKSDSTPDKKYYYKYSQQACLDQCLHQLTKKYCRCILPKSMIDTNTEKLPLCSRCNDIRDNELNSMCDCKPSCENVEFQVIKKDFVLQLHIEQDLEFFNGFSRTQPVELKDLEPIKHDWNQPPPIPVEDTQLKKHNGSQRPPFPWEDPNFHAAGFAQAPLRRKRFSFAEVVKSVLIDDHLIITERHIKEPSMKLESLLSALGCAWNMWLGYSFSVVFSVTIAFCFKKVKNTNLKLNLFLQKLTFNTTILLIATIFIAQAYLLIKEYLQFKVEEVDSRELQNSLDFPTTYVCFPDNTYKSALMTSSGWQLDMGSFPNVEKCIATCEFQTQTGNKLPCRTQVIHFLTEEGYVNCASVRPQNSSQDLRLTDLQMELKFITFEIIADATRMLLTFNPFAGLHTSVVRLPVDQIYISPGDALDLQFSLVEARRLPKPYSSKCRDERSNYTMWQDRVRDFAHHIKYTYNFEDCLFFCVSETKDIEQCDCQLPCRDFKYNFDVVQKQNETWQKFLKRYIFTEWQQHDFIKTSSASVRIRQPLLKKVITEKPALDLINLSSQLGGLFMFWLGIPVLALIAKFTISFFILSIY